METKVQIKIDKTNTRMQVVRGILEKHKQPKLVPELFDWQTNEKGCTVTYYLGNTEKEKFFSFGEIYSFIGGFYNAIVDRFDNGEHVQYVDSQTPADYFTENTSDVLTDFLKHKI